MACPVWHDPQAVPSFSPCLEICDGKSVVISPVPCHTVSCGHLPTCGAGPLPPQRGEGGTHHLLLRGRKHRGPGVGRVPWTQVLQTESGRSSEGMCPFGLSRAAGSTPSSCQSLSEITCVTSRSVGRTIGPITVLKSIRPWSQTRAPKKASQKPRLSPERLLEGDMEQSGVGD